ncbi:MAG: hypothetical protein K0S74_1494 [Chlamydiales bacterium]|jgi:hypothetical protein|nr:hypothetical protein [Chlamydiales bacterium]
MRLLKKIKFETILSKLGKKAIAEANQKNNQIIEWVNSIKLYLVLEKVRLF